MERVEQRRFNTIVENVKDLELKEKLHVFFGKDFSFLKKIFSSIFQVLAQWPFFFSLLAKILSEF